MPTLKQEVQSQLDKGTSLDSVRANLTAKYGMPVQELKQKWFDKDVSQLDAYVQKKRKDDVITMAFKAF